MPIARYWSVMINVAVYLMAAILKTTLFHFLLFLCVKERPIILAGVRENRNMYSIGPPETRSRILERTISMRFLGIILRVLSLSVSQFLYGFFKP